MKSYLQKLKEEERFEEIEKSKMVLQRMIRDDQQELMRILETQNEWKINHLQNLIYYHKMQLDEIYLTLNQ